MTFKSLLSGLPQLPTNRLQRMLLQWAGVFLFLYSLALTLSPASRARSWLVAYRWDHWIGFGFWLVLAILAQRVTSRQLPDRDPYLLPAGALLSGWGLLTIWRLFPEFGWRQSIWLVVVGVIFLLGLRLPNDLSYLRKYKYLWLTGGLLLTGLTLLLGTNPSALDGPRLWLGCCGVYFQPSEPLKLLLIIYLAAYLADKQPAASLAALTGSPKARPILLPFLAPSLTMAGLAMLLLVVQRDLGTASIFFFLYAAVVYLATQRIRVLLVMGLMLLGSAAGGYWLFDVVRIRMEAWLNPWLDPSGRSYQIVQSLIAVANGGLLGRGPGMGSPNFVPVPHSDFIFAAVAEESGLIGIIALLSIFALLVMRGTQIALHSPQRFERYLAAGLTAYLVGQTILIAGGNLRLLPLTGVTLPFLSYGGSSLLTTWISLLLLLHISNLPQDQPLTVRSPLPYLRLSGFLLAGLVAVSLAAGWWAYLRGPDLLARTDNPRRALADRTVQRGAIYDRKLNPLSVTGGEPGNLFRQALYPPLGSIVGYTHAVYGQAGLEASLDDYLRGLRGNPGLTIWWHHLLYGEPPPGLDIRLSLDLELQKTADQLLGEKAGALVLLNANSGEVLAIASHPTFDPNQLDQNWSQLVADPSAPLFNRATLGRYPPGAALGPFLYAAVQARTNLPALPQDLSASIDGQSLPCALPVNTNTWPQAIAAGCPNAQLVLAESLGDKEVLSLLDALGLFARPSFDLPTAGESAPRSFQNETLAFAGLDEIAISPLQAASAAAVLSNAGVRPTPHLANGVRLPEDGWSLIPPSGAPMQVFTPAAAASAADQLVADTLPVWHVVSVVPTGEGQALTWYLAGTLPDWHGSPLALAILLEEENPALIQVIGEAMFQATLRP